MTPGIQPALTASEWISGINRGKTTHGKQRHKPREAENATILIRIHDYSSFKETNMC